VSASCSGRQVGIPEMVVYMNKVDQVDDDRLLELKWNSRVLSRYDYNGDDIPVIPGSGAARDERRDA
jgi:elongation factor Tu